MEQPDPLGSFLKQAADEIGIALNPGHIDAFLSYLEQLKRWNQTINLTSITQDREIIIKHFVDSLAGLNADRIPESATLLDIGTGAGFPGIPLKIVRPDLELTLVEPVNKKVSFIRFMIGRLHLDHIHTFEGTVDQLLTNKTVHGSFDFVVTRALKLDVTAKCLGQLLKKTGKAIVYLSESIDRRVLPADISVVREYEFELPKKYGKRTISVLAVHN